MIDSTLYLEIQREYSPKLLVTVALHHGNICDCLLHMVFKNKMCLKIIVVETDLGQNPNDD